MTSYVVRLDGGEIPRSIGGGKAASLSALIAGGFPVPPGFCVTATAYERFAADTGLPANSASLLEGVEPRGDSVVSGQLAALWDEASLPGDVAEQISAAYHDLDAGGEIAVAVRSSAVAEDGTASSYAGAYETFLNVRGHDGVLDAVLRCYRSLWSQHALRYRASQGGAGASEAMAVVVQRLALCDAAGVAFTADPMSGRRDRVVINASWGLGEAIVSGLVTPDWFVVAKSDLALLERRIWQKELAIGRDEAGGTREEILTPERAASASITDDQAREIAGLAIRAEAMFGPPQDVEWGLAGGQVYLLQSRPITTL